MLLSNPIVTMMNNYIAFQANPDLKLSCIHGMKQVIKANKLTQDQSWDVQAYARAIQTPLVLAELIQAIFKYLPEEEAFDWAIDHLEAIPVGRDLSTVWPSFVDWLMFDKDQGLIHTIKQPALKDLYHSARSALSDTAAIQRLVHEIDQRIQGLTIDNDPHNIQLYQLIILKSILLGHPFQILSNLSCLFESLSLTSSKAMKRLQHMDDYQDYLVDLGIEPSHDVKDMDIPIFLEFVNEMKISLTSLLNE